MRFYSVFWLVLVLQVNSGWAQSRDRGDSRDGGGGGRDRGSRSERYGRGDRGGDEEGSDRSRSSRWGGGGFGGGPGGFSGGFGMPFGGGSFGGGSSFGGGFSDMIRRFDRNGNNMIDPDEVVGPAGFFLQRMAQNNPKIDPSRPIPLDLIIGEIERFRSGMSGVEGMGGEDDPGTSGGSDAELLVPDFRLDSTPEPIQGFGSVATTKSAPVTDRDKAEAEDRIRRYDRNRDGFLTPDELSQGRWSGDPLQFDRNRDGRLSVEELASRQAERRAQEERDRGDRSSFSSARSGEWGSGMGAGGWSRGFDPTAQGGGRNGTEEEGSTSRKSPEERFGDAKSYRINSSVVAPENLPSFFISRDSNRDGQVTLKEFSAELSDQSIVDFAKWDLNADGVITRRESVAANKLNGDLSMSGGAPAPAATAAPASSQASERPNPRQTSSPPVRGSAGSDSSSSKTYTDEEIEWAKRQIEKYDKDGDAALSKSEWEQMVVRPHTADTNRDGKITVEEYATFRARGR